MIKPSRQIRFQKLKGWKYQLVDDELFQTNILGKSIINGYVILHVDGTLLIKQGYCWDGPSGITIDTHTFMRASLVHDALYQLMRTNKLDRTLYRSLADAMLRTMCLQDGMHPWRAWYVYKAVRWFGEKYTHEAGSPRHETFVAPQ